MDLIQWTEGRDSQLNPGTRVLKKHVSASDWYCLKQINGWETGWRNYPHTYYCFKSFVTNGQCFERKSGADKLLSRHIWQWSDFIHETLISRGTRSKEMIDSLFICMLSEKKIHLFFESKRTGMKGTDFFDDVSSEACPGDLYLPFWCLDSWMEWERRLVFLPLLFCK